MTMNSIQRKLRKKNKGQYLLLEVCIFLSVVLVSSFAMMYFSKTVQTMLPQGGDSRSLALLLFAVTAIGCTIFTLYGTGLFFRYKSRELGVFLALGETKRRMAKVLFSDLFSITCRSAISALLVSIPLSWAIFRLFCGIALPAGTLAYHMQISGFLPGLAFALLLMACILFTAWRFIRRTDIIDILNTQRKTESPQILKPWLGKLGIALVIIGLLLAMGVPSITANFFLVKMPAFWNGSYLLSVVGLYLVMLSAVGNTSRGKHPQRYYRNIISTNLMRFTAKQTTKNMCVMTLLISVLLLSSFWGGQYYYSAYSSSDTAPVDYSLHYPKTEQPVSKDGIFQLAREHDVEITSYEEADALQLIVSFSQRDLTDDGKYVDITTEKLASFLSASDYARISGEKIALKKGEYCTVVSTGYKRNIFEGPDGLDRISAPDGSHTQALSYKGTTAFDNLTVTSEPFAFILSDPDYQSYLRRASSENMERMIFFNVKNVQDSYPFAVALKNDFIANSGKDMDHIGLYDAHEEALAHEKGETYAYSGSADLSTDNVDLLNDWKYAPFFKILQKTDAMQMVAIFVLLSAYIAIISLAAISILAFVRSLTIALDNRQLFKDIQKLGADKDYVRRILVQQLKKVFTYPAIVGSGIVLCFAFFMIIFNDLRIQTFEWVILGMLAGIDLLLFLYMYLIYRVSFRRVRQIVEI